MQNLTRNMVASISTLDPTKFKGLDHGQEDLCIVEVTVSTGFELESAEECIEKLMVEPQIFRGKLFFDVPVADVEKVLKLRSIDHASVVTSISRDFEINDDREKTFEKLYKFAERPNWKKGMEVWQKFQSKDFSDSFDHEIFELKGSCIAKPELDLRSLKDTSRLVPFLPKEVLDAKNLLTENSTKGLNDKSHGADDKPVTKQYQRILCGPNFRVTCHKGGVNYNFGSSEAARQFGGGVNTKFGWPVDLSNYDLDIQLNLCPDVMYTSIALTKDVLFKRNVIQFGRTNLRATMCYNMLRMAKPQKGDIVLDHMCGGATIPLEGALTYKDCLHIGGDNFYGAVCRARVNIDNQVETEKQSIKADIIHWDACKLPLRDQCVNVVVSDLPFGKRMGSKYDNRTLYYNSLLELARVVKTDEGRAVLLTHDKSSMVKSIARLGSLWKNSFTRTVNIGGLAAGVYLLKRTSLMNDGSILPVGVSKKTKKFRTNEKSEIKSENLEST